MFDFCIPCKYFNYIVTSVGHFLFVCFSQVLDELESYVNYLKEVHEKKTFGENQSDLLCNGCQLPMNGHESNAEFAKFPKCALPLEIKKHRVSMARIKLFYSAMDRNLSLGNVNIFTICIHVVNSFVNYRLWQSDRGVVK